MNSLFEQFSTNKNLNILMIQFLTWKDIIILSQVSKFYYKITQHFDDHFKKASHDYFCSNYLNYR